jgi:putative membrane protein
MAELRRIDAGFLATLGIGAIVAVVAVAELLTYLLEEQHDPTYGFFFGLVLASVVVPYRMIRRKSIGASLAALVAMVLVVGMTLGMSGEERLQSARKKAAMKAAAAEVVSGDDVPQEVAQAARRGVPRTPRTMILFFLAGAIAISAMILPGISGSFMLLLMGVYFDVLACVTGRQLVLLGIFAVGCMIGLLVFTRLLKFLLEHYHDLTMAFLLGLVLGSLYAIWPFKSYGMAGGKRVDMDNILPQAVGQNELLTLVAVLLGIGVVATFLWIESRKGMRSSS